VVVLLDKSISGVEFVAVDTVDNPHSTPGRIKTGWNVGTADGGGANRAWHPHADRRTMACSNRTSGNSSSQPSGLDRYTRELEGA
jgi:hypothetical protein